jgi:hypothetical protein
VKVFVTEPNFANRLVVGAWPLSSLPKDSGPHAGRNLPVLALDVVTIALAGPQVAQSPGRPLRRSPHRDEHDGKTMVIRPHMIFVADIRSSPQEWSYPKKRMPDLEFNAETSAIALPRTVAKKY